MEYIMEYNNGIIWAILKKCGTFSCNFSIDSRAHVCETRDKLEKLLRFLVTKLLDVRDDEF